MKPLYPVITSCLLCELIALTSGLPWWWILLPVVAVAALYLAWMASMALALFAVALATALTMIVQSLDWRVR